jgi:uncharacterized protein (TIGR03086 family)
VAPLSKGLELLESAVGYALCGITPGASQLLSRPTPCAGWDLELLLGHVSDSIGVLHQAIATGTADAPVAPAGHPGAGPDPVARLRGRACGLLGACAAAGPGGRLVAIGGRQLTASLVTVTAALEIAVHGWDIAVACGAGRPVPPGLATALLAIAPLVIGPADRAGLFAEPVLLPAQPAPATSSSPSSAATRRFPATPLVYISKPPDRRRTTATTRPQNGSNNHENL